MPGHARAIHFGSMTIARKPAAYLALFLLFMFSTIVWAAPAPPSRPPKATAAHSAPKRNAIDDSLALPPARDLNLTLEGAHKADALAHFAEGIDLEENGEMEKALEAYRQVLNVDPGQIELAVRVAALLTRDDDYPGAIDVLKEVIKVHPKASEPYLELAFIYAKYLNKLDQAIEFANKAIALDPQRIDGLQRLFEIHLIAGDEKKATETLDRAAKVHSDRSDVLGRTRQALWFSHFEARYRTNSRGGDCPAERCISEGSGKWSE